MSEGLMSQYILWKPVKIVSIIIYSVIFIFYPFNTFWATILLFALIAFWSRIPCLISPFTKDFEVVDFFTVMLAIHVGGIFGGIFGATILLFSRVFGPNEYILYTVKDSICLLVGGILTPFFFSMTGSALYTIYLFTAVRYAGYLILTLLIEPQFFMLELGYCAAGIGVAYLSNTLIMKLFEAPLSNAFEGGLHFDITIFLFATLVIFFFYGASRFAKWFEQRQVEKARAEGSVYEKFPFYMLDADAKKGPLFVRY
jgi:hypothetical protein